MDAKTFGAFIQSQRRALDLTQAELAEKLHVTDKAVSRWERGVGFPEITLLEPLAQALDVSLIELLQSQKLEASTLSPGEAEAVVAGALELAQKEVKSVYRSPLWWGSYLAVCAVMLFFISVLTFFVDARWIRALGVYLTICCGNFAMRAVERAIRRRYQPSLPPLSLRDWISYMAAFLGGLLLILSFPIRSQFGKLPCDLGRILGFALMGVGFLLTTKDKKAAEKGK